MSLVSLDNNFKGVKVLKIMNNKRLTVVDFFCGAGGFSEGFRRAGFDVVMGIDNWKPAIETHNFNHNLNDNPKSVLDFEDISEIEKLPDTDVIIGSPPCQLFSISNRGGNADKGEGIRLIKTFFKIIAVKKFKKNSNLKAWLMENVPNSKNFVEDSYTFSDLDLDEWAKSQGINPQKVAIRAKNNGGILHSDDYGSAQVRKRFVCGEFVPNGEFPYPDITNFDNKVTLSKLFENFPKPLSQSQIKNVYDPNYPCEIIDIRNLRDHFYDTGIYQVQWQKARDAKQKHPYMGRMSFPENMEKPSRTIMATMSASTREAIIYKSELNRKGDGEYRLPTIREAAIIMGFPLYYQFYGNESVKWRLVGNAVCVQLSYALARKILQNLKAENLSPKVIKRNIQQLTYLDTSELKKFDNPPVRNSKALFRQFPIKSGNMTVDLTNKVNGEIGNWGVIAHAGSGKGFTQVFVTRQLQLTAKTLLNEFDSELIKIIENDSVIIKYSNSYLNEANKKYGYTEEDKTHPYYIINYIGKLVEKTLDGRIDKNINVSETRLSVLKKDIRLSQIMSLYLVPIIIYGK